VPRHRPDAIGAGTSDGPVTRRPAPRLRAYIVLGAVALLAGVALGRPEPVILAAPLLLAALVGLALAEDPGVSVTASIERDRVLEGEDVGLALDVVATRSVPWLEVAVRGVAGMGARDGSQIVRLQLAEGDHRVESLQLVFRRWGIYRLASMAVRARDRFGLVAWESTLETDIVVRVFPRPETLRRAIQPAETQVFSGNEVSRRRGDGIEFADVRPYAPGDLIRHVNWRLSSSRDELHVNERHPESNNDVVLLLDTYTDVENDQGETSLGLAVRAANGLVDHYLRRRDRVGVIRFGGTVRWLAPTMGLAHAYQIVEMLLDAQAMATHAWKGAEVIPRRALPPKALVIALSPLLDERVVEALLDLRGRGFDLAVIEIRPEGFVGPATTQLDSLARRVWRLRRELLHHRYRRLGVAVASWGPGESLEAVLEEVRAFRRSARPAAA
jgi:uncharacterized protein (DUF58 family)